MNKNRLLYCAYRSGQTITPCAVIANSLVKLLRQDRKNFQLASPRDCTQRLTGARELEGGIPVAHKHRLDCRS